MAPLFASISSLGSSDPRPTAQRGPAAEVIRRGRLKRGGHGTLCGAAGFGIRARSVLFHAAWRQEYSAENRASVEGRSFPVMEHPTRVGNRLLAALPPADFDLLAPYLRKVPLERDAVLVRSGDPIEQIYFPESGTIAFIMDMPNGQTVATAVIGNEGAVGVLYRAGTLPLSDDGGRTRGRDLIANFSSTISCGPQPQSRHPTCGPDPHQRAAGAIPARGRLQCAALGRGPLGPVVAPHPRSS